MTTLPEIKRKLLLSMQMTPPSSFEITMSSYWVEINKLGFIVHKPEITEKRLCHMMYPHVTWFLMDDVNGNWKSKT